MSISNLDQLIEDARPVDGIFTFEIGKEGFKVEFSFELPQTYGAWSLFRKSREEWVSDHRKFKSCPYDEIKDYWVSDSDSLAAVHDLHFLSREPAKITLLDAFKMLRAPALVEGLQTQIEIHRARLIAATLEEVEREKNA